MEIAKLLTEDYQEKSVSKGLTTKQAHRLLEEKGPNALEEKKKVHAGVVLLSQFKNLMTLILIVSTILSVLLGEYAEAIAILAIVLLNAIMGFIQEYKAEKTLEKLKKLAAPVARVYRDGVICELPSEKLVPGDVILLKAGDRVAADGVILTETALECDESVLTGESLPCIKKPAEERTPAEDIHSVFHVYKGTVTVKGHAEIQITATGMSTAIGQIAKSIAELEEEPTPLQKRLAELSKIIAIGCLGICAMVTLVGIFRGYGVFDMLVTGVSLAVAAVPEGLPAIVTIALALSVNRMIKQNALIKKLYAVETLGCTSVICSDKTGTLTENRMTVKEIVTANVALEISGDGDSMSGGFHLDGAVVKATDFITVSQLLHIAVLCNNSVLHLDKKGFSERAGRNRLLSSSNKKFKFSGDPTETALLIACAKGGITAGDLEKNFERMNENPFDSIRKRMSVTVRSRQGNKVLMVKGAPDIIIGKAKFYLTEKGIAPLTGKEKSSVIKRLEQLCSEGMRVIAFAYKELAEEAQVEEDNLIFVGMAALWDPPRKEVALSVRQCREAGIRPVMITGDHKVTAVSIAKQIGIYKEDTLCVTGEEMDNMSQAEFERKLPFISVFARVTPKHKLKIVEMYKRAGAIVAMTGDGVNDAPAVKASDIGVSMGITGTDVTKEAASVILLDDNFKTLVFAVSEGRVIYRNIRKFIRYLLSCNIGEVITMLIGMIMGIPVILLPMQILLVNLITDGLPAIALGMEPAEREEMKTKPREAGESIFSGGLLETIVFRGILIGLTTLGVFVYFTGAYHDVTISRTAALYALCLTQLIHVFECKSEHRSLFSIPIFSNPYLLGAVLISFLTILAAIYVPIFNTLLATAPLTVMQLLITTGFCFIAPILSVFFIMNPKKRLKSKKENDMI